MVAPCASSNSSSVALPASRSTTRPVAPVCDLLQAKRVAVERERAVELGDGEGDA
jgi:hypothetical protein